MVVLLLLRDAAEVCGATLSKILATTAIIPQQAEQYLIVPLSARPVMEPFKGNYLGQRAKRRGSPSHGYPLWWLSKEPKSRASESLNPLSSDNTCLALVPCQFLETNVNKHVSATRFNDSFPSLVNLREPCISESHLDKLEKTQLLHALFLPTNIAFFF